MGLNVLGIKVPRIDRRKWRWFWQKNKRGFSDRDMWNLDQTIGQFVLPRLKYFKEVSCGVPGDLTDKQWDNILQEMIDAFELIADEHLYYRTDKDQDEIIDRGLSKFATYYRALWD